MSAWAVQLSLFDEPAPTLFDDVPLPSLTVFRELDLRPAVFYYAARVRAGGGDFPSECGPLTDEQRAYIDASVHANRAKS